MKGRVLVLVAALAAVMAAAGAAQAAAPTLVDSKLQLRTAVGGLNLPTGIAFIGPNDMLVLEKDTGRVRRVINGVIQGTVLDLSVNNFSERGLLGIALHPSFPTIPQVFFYWTCRSAAALDDDPFTPEETECSDANMTGLPDSNDVLQVPLLGNRIDRFVWNGSTLTFDRHLITLLGFQNDGAPTPPGQGDDASGPHGQQPARGNHDGGVLAFGPDHKLYVFVGDVGRRGQLQNLAFGPTPPTADDQFGGPAPDDAHFTGVILRLNDDGSTPTDNPFVGVGGNVAKVYAYGVRNSFGMAFDPFSGNLWDQENGEDAFDEMNLIERGMNSGWVQTTGPLGRIGEYKQIETTALHHEDFPNLQQFRWGPEKIADSQQEALSRMFVLPGSHYSDPEFSWKHVLAPAAIGFAGGRGLGPQYEGDLFVGFSTLDTLGGPLFRFNLTGNRRKIAVDDPRLEDRVADNVTFHDMTESESLLFGRDFGIVTDIETGPNGNLFVVSLLSGTVYEIAARR
jgi:glucose/arabinose dehydrogenase